MNCLCIRIKLSVFECVCVFWSSGAIRGCGPDVKETGKRKKETKKENDKKSKDGNDAI